MRSGLALNEIWLKKHLKLPNGTPGKDTFRRVLSSLNPIVFQQCFGQWLESLRAAGDGESNDGESNGDATHTMRHVAIDGKTLSSVARQEERPGAFARCQCLGERIAASRWFKRPGAEKSNAITGSQELLAIIDIEDAVVTIDAAGCQKNIARRIVEGKGDYVLALKGNQKTLFDEVQLLLGCHLQDDFANCPVSRHVEVEQGHGRLEARRYYQITAPSDLHGRSQWKGLRMIGVAVRTYEQNSVEKTDARYYLSSLRRNGKRFAADVRRH